MKEFGPTPPQIKRWTVAGFLGTAGGGLVGEICERCDERIFPLRDLCPACGDRGPLQEIRAASGVIFESSRGAGNSSGQA